MKLRNVAAMNRINDAAHSRSLTDSIMAHEVIAALRHWAKAGAGGILIGAVSWTPKMRQLVKVEPCP
jgi:2,4-dienoyl-CoA reductase-like NADH-dependent reductase (Old Yellow Enzyme family)